MQPSVGAHAVVAEALWERCIRTQLRQEVGRFIDGEQVHAAQDGSLQLLPFRQDHLAVPQRDEDLPVPEGAYLCAGADVLGMVLVVQMSGRDFL